MKNKGKHIKTQVLLNMKEGKTMKNTKQTAVNKHLKMKKAMLGIAIAGTVAAPVSTVFAATPIEGDTSSAQTTVTQQTQSNASTANTPTQTAQSSSTAEKAPAAASLSSASQTSTAAQPSAPSTSTAGAASQKQVSKGADTTADHGSSASSQSTPKAATATTAPNTGSTASQGTSGSSTGTASTVSVPKQTADSAKDTKTDNTNQQDTKSSGTKASNQKANVTVLAESAKDDNNAAQSYINVNDDYKTAKQNYETAKDNAAKASDTKDAASAKKKAADKTLADAKQNVSDKTDALKTAQIKADQADKALADAKADEAKAEKTVSDKQQAFDKAQAAYSQAKDDADTKGNLLDNAQSELNALQKSSALEQAQKALSDAQSAEAEAQDAVDSAKTKADAAKQKLNDAQTAKDTAAAKVSDAQKAADDAKAKADAAQKALDEAQKVYDKTGKAFIEKGVGDPDQSFDNYVAVMKTEDALKDYVNDKDFQKALDKALTVDALRKDIALMREGNALRAKEGKSELNVNYSAMEMSALSGAVSSVAFGNHNTLGHIYYNNMLYNPNAIYNASSSAFSGNASSENIAFEQTDPYSSWYYGEGANTKIADYVRQNGYSKAGVTKLMQDLNCSEDYTLYVIDTMESYDNGKGVTKDNIDDFASTYLSDGHYQNLIDSKWTDTGFAFIDENDFNYPHSFGGGYYATATQSFVQSGQSGQSLSIDAFEAALNDFVKDAETKLNNAKTALADAQTAKQKADDALAAAKTDSQSADSAYTDAKAQADAADQAYTDAQAALKTAQANTEKAKAARDQAAADDNAQTEAIAAKQAAVDAAKQAKVEADAKLKDAETAKNAADADLKSAKQDAADAKAKVNDAQTKADKQQDALNTTKDALKTAQTEQDKAQQNDDNAAVAETTAISDFKNADGLEKQAYDAYQKSGQNLVDFVDQHIEALPDADKLTLDDKDDVNTMAEIVAAVPSELAGSLNQDDLRKLAAAQVKIAELEKAAQQDSKTDHQTTDKTKTDAQKAQEAKNVKDFETMVKALPKNVTAKNARSVHNLMVMYGRMSDSERAQVSPDLLNKLQRANSSIEDGDHPKTGDNSAAAAAAAAGAAGIAGAAVPTLLKKKKGLSE